MPALRDALTNAGFDRVETYVQSGNVALDGPDDPGAVRRDVENAIAERFGFGVTVVVRSRVELEATVASNPYADEAATDPTKVHAFFVASELADDVWTAFDMDQFSPEEMSMGPGVVYVHTPNGLGRAKLPDAIGKHLRPVEMTARNWRTVLKLVEMVSI